MQNVGRHVQKSIKELPHPSERFITVNLDIAGPLGLLESNTYEKRPRYLLTMIEAAPLSEFSAISGSRFDPPPTSVADSLELHS